VLAAAGVFAVRWLTPAPGPAADTPSVEAAWADAIGKYGLEPVFPPEEDLSVGDVLAVVVSDDDADPETQDKKVGPRAPFLKRSVKIAHVDVRKELDATYAALPVFAAPPSVELAKATTGNPAAPPAKAHSVARLFTTEVQESDLPRAAFTSLKIQGTNSAAAGLSAGTAAGASYGASNEGVEELRLADVSTYGLPSARALDALNRYCTAEATKADCLESTARKHLQRVVGDRINVEYVDTKGNSRHAIRVEVVVVSRVYLTRSIEHLRRVGSSQSGGASLSGLFGMGEGRTAAPAAASALPAPEPSAAKPGSEPADTIEMVALRKRLETVEKQLAQARSGGSLVSESSFGTQILLKEKLDRPVAFGYRSVAFQPAAPP
jgi:hypothetical protein